MTRDTVIQTLRERQRQMNETDLEFARRLRISRQMWQAIRTGDREPGTETLQKMATAFPDLIPHVLALFLPATATNVNLAATTDTPAGAR